MRFSNLGRNRNFVLSNQSDIVQDEDDFELVIWVVIV